jgi:nitrous oxidase accessory protein
VKVLFLLSCLLLFLSANPLQDAIDKVSPYATIKLHKGTYEGAVTIDKPLTIIGLDEGVVIDAKGKGSVITIKSSDVTLKNLHIQGSGSHSYTIDAAIAMKDVKRCKILSCSIENVLYGIDMYMVSDSRIEKNIIRSNGDDIAMRGDGLKLYYSHNNIFVNNLIENVRDVTLHYSNNNLFEHNRFYKNRFATHIALSHDNILRKNEYRYNSVSVMLMGAKDTQVVANTIHSSKGAAGIGVMIGAVMNLRFESNSVRYNAKALYIDGKEKEAGIKRYILHNEIAYNAEAFHFHATIKDNQILYNNIFGNIEDVVKDVAGGFRSSNEVAYNYWDRYSGFDRDKDGIGDRPYDVYQYIDKLWHYNKSVKFFYASPIMTLLDFLEQLAPFIEPTLIMRDAKPCIYPNDLTF